MVNQANLACPAHQASLVALHWRFARKCHHHRADHAHRDHPDLPVHLANLVHPDQMATLAALAKMAETDHPVHQAPTERPAAQAQTDKKDPLETQLLPFHRLPASPAQLVKMVHPAQPVKTAPLVPMEAPAHQETKVHPVQLDHPATTVLPEIKDPLVQMVPRENRVFAPNIAPPMAVFSSKMAQGDKRFLNRICYTDEKPVFFMSMFAFFIFVFDYFKQSSSIDTAAASPLI